MIRQRTTWKEIFRHVGRATGKRPESIARYVERHAIGPDLVELMRDRGTDVAKLLTKLVTNNPRIRNTER